MKELKYEKYPKDNFKPDSLIVLMHGIGADAFDLLSLAKHWSTKLNKTQFYSLHAPLPYTLSSSGRQWFGLEDRDQTRILEEINEIKPLIINFLEKKLFEKKLTFENLVLVGFSQGTMVALNIGLSMNKKIKGILGYSGGIILTKSGKIIINSKPNICLIHGIDDDIVPKKMMEVTEVILKENNLLIETHLIQNLGHSINNEALEIGEKFLVKYLLK